MRVVSRLCVPKPVSTAISATGNVVSANSVLARDAALFDEGVRRLSCRGLEREVMRAERGAAGQIPQMNPVRHIRFHELLHAPKRRR